MTLGFVRPGYERVREAFETGAPTFGRGGGAYCAYVDGEPVIDLWAGTARPGTPWEAGTTTVIMSATKGLVALCVQMLVDRGELDLDAPVATYWPEFGQNGKESTLVRHVMLHTAGVLGFPGQTDLLNFDGTGWDDYEAIAAGFAASAPEWEPGSKHGYHALSFGWLAGEIVRRASGRSVGTYFQEEIAGPLGIECWIGTPSDELRRVARVHKTRVDHLPGFLRKAYEGAERVASDPTTLSGRAFLGGNGTSGISALELLFNNPKVLGAEFPAGGATSTARALARLWAVLAADGELDGKRLFSRESVAQWGEIASNTPDVLMAEVPLPRMLAGKEASVPRTLGYLGNGAMPGLGHRFGPNPDAFGAEGLGGQFAFCDRRSRIAVGYVRSDLAMIDVLQPTLTPLVYECASRLGHDVYVPAPVGLPKRLVGRAAGALLRRRVAVRPAPES
ncbi:MAG: beta-lactamase family protein [Actinomycetota bacterium]|nr:beta-lactamase family protein [Actinomycetota bacterium]